MRPIRQNAAASLPQLRQSEGRHPARLKSEWPDGDEHSVVAINPSHCDEWLANQAARVGRSHYNAYIQLLRAVFDFAVRDRIVAENPAAHLKYLKREKPIRLTPSWEEFHAIVRDIRNQPFNADAEASADFVEFIGLTGLGQQKQAPSLGAMLIWSGSNHDLPPQDPHRIRYSHLSAGPTSAGRLNARRRGQTDGRVFESRTRRKRLAACRRLKLPHYTHRSFRRLFITRAIENGVDVKVIAEWQGHETEGSSFSTRIRTSTQRTRSDGVVDDN